MSGWEQRNADFCKAQTDAGFAYIEAERRVKALEAENDQLREKLKEETVENKWAREFLNGIAERIRQANAHSLVNYVEKIEDQNAKLRKLVRAMWLYDYAGKFSPAHDDVEHVAMVYQEMRKLGVEI